VRLLRAKAMIRKELLETIAGQEMFEFFAVRCDRVVTTVLTQLNIEQGTRNIEY
jgi:hypothetical protein